MRRTLLLGLLAALPLAVAPLVWAAAGGGSPDGATLTEFRDASRLAAPEPAGPAVVAVAASPSRVSFLVTRAVAVEVAIVDARGALVRRLGHFTVPARKRLVLAWDGAGAPAGSVAVVTAGKATVRTPVLPRLAGADDADRQSLRQPGHA
jgi:hypothetical protein